MRSASPFFVSLPSIRFSEGESTGVQRCGGYWWHTRYAFVLGVRSGVPQVVRIKLIHDLCMDQLDLRVNLKDTDQLHTCGSS